jgi:hypothetical protein
MEYRSLPPPVSLSIFEGQYGNVSQEGPSARLRENFEFKSNESATCRVVSRAAGID